MAVNTTVEPLSEQQRKVLLEYTPEAVRGFKGIWSNVQRQYHLEVHALYGSGNASKIYPMPWSATSTVWDWLENRAHIVQREAAVSGLKMALFIPVLCGEAECGRLNWCDASACESQSTFGGLYSIVEIDGQYTLAVSTKFSLHTVNEQ